MKILINGGGIAGLTLAALLQQRGLQPTVIDRISQYSLVGYVLSLWPLGNRVLHGLQLYSGYQDLSAPLTNYMIHRADGRLLKDFDVRDLTEKYGEIRTLTRADLLELLRAASGGITVQTNCTVHSLKTVKDRVEVELSDGSQDTFDLVVGADGLNSRVRSLLFGHLPTTDTGMIVVGGWIDQEIYPLEEVHEFWGSPALLGLYSNPHRTAYALVLPDLTADPVDDHEYYREAALLQVSDPDLPIHAILREQMQSVPQLDLYKLEDIRIPQWHTERVVLLGDAAAAFLPTAGIGASMAMESAAVLNDELSRVNTQHIPDALNLYVQRRRKRVDAIQQQSRLLAKVMGIRNPLLAKLRNAIIPWMNERMMFGSIYQRLDDPI